MPRQKDDGRGRLGGRAAGTPNKEKPLKTFLRQHSQSYFEPNITVDQHFIDDFASAAAIRMNVPLTDVKKYEKWLCPFNIGDVISQFDADSQTLSAEDRVRNEIALLKFHTPQMQSTSVDMSVTDNKKSLAKHLASLAGGDSN